MGGERNYLGKQLRSFLLFLCCASLFAFFLDTCVMPVFDYAPEPAFHEAPTVYRIFLWLRNWFLPHFCAVSCRSVQEGSAILTFIDARITFLCVIVAAFIVYGLCLLLVRKDYILASTWTFWMLWVGTMIIGGVLVVTPVMLSRDIFGYASLGRLMVFHHANPYFTSLSHYPLDPFARLDEWNTTTSAYGPIWLVVCALFAFLAGSVQLRYILVFRLLGLLLHLWNGYLVYRLLKELKCSRQRQLLGTLLYLWNPLVLLEGVLGGHNDICLLSFTLMGLLYCRRAEEYGSFRLRRFIPTLLFFVLAVTIKIAAVPLVALWVVFIFSKALSAFNKHYDRYSRTTDYSQKPSGAARERETSGLAQTLRMCGYAVTLCGILLFICYFPFWRGHNILDIFSSFTSPPSSYLAQNSILRVIQAWKEASGDMNSFFSLLVAFFSLRSTWNVICILTMLVCCVVGSCTFYRESTTRTFILIALLTQEALLIVAPWFYPWYVISLIGFAAVCLPTVQSAFRRRALIGFALTFSYSSLLTYLFSGNPALIETWSNFFFTQLPPLALVFIFGFVNPLVPPISVFALLSFVRGNTAAKARRVGAAVGEF